MTTRGGFWSSLRQWLAGAFVENLLLKALALLIAVVLFASLQGRQDEQIRTVPVGVVLRSPTDGVRRELMTPIPASIHVTVKGPARALDQLQGTVPPVEIDLRDGERDEVSFESKMFSFPPGVEVTIIDPPSLRLDWQEVISRRIGVQASITGTPAEGFQVKGSPEVHPGELTVSGPRSLVETLQFARVAAFDVSGLTDGRHERLIAIDPPPPRVTALGPQAARVIVTIARRLTEVRFAKRPVEVIGVTNGVPTPRTVDVTVLGPPEVVRALRAEQVVPRADLNAEPGVDLDEMKHGTAVVKVTVDLAQAEAEVQPPTVKVQW